MINEVAIFGERCSGTNFIEKLIRTNFDVKITRDYGFKHWFIKDHQPRGKPNFTTDYECLKDLKDTDDVLFVCIFRNPYDWLRSLHRKAYHAPDHANISFSEFIRKEWTSYETSKASKLWKDKKIDKKYWIESAENICKLRSQKIQHLFSLRDKVKNVVYVNYDEINENPAKLKKLIEKFNVKLKKEEFNMINKEKYVSKYQEITAKDLKFINTNLTWSLENQIGSEKIDNSKNIQNIQNKVIPRFNWKQYIKSRPDLKKNWNGPIRATIHKAFVSHLDKRNISFKPNQTSTTKNKRTKGKVGIVITYHNHHNKFGIPCTESVLKHTPKPRYILAYDNASTEERHKDIPDMFKDEEDFHFIRIEDEHKNGGLTGTWNQGIDLCIKNGCEKIILLNHDTLVDESWKIFIENLSDDKACYGPSSNDPGWNKANQKRTKIESLKKKNSVYYGELVNGFCMGFTKNALILNKFDDTYYFDPQYPFGGNELEWQERFQKKEGKFVGVEGSFVFHHGHHGWDDRLVVLLRILRDAKDKTYLEIGVNDGYFLCHVRTDKRIGIEGKIENINKHYFPDIAQNKKVSVYEMTSDDFFKQNILENEKIDIAHIAGIYSYEKAKKDIENCLEHLDEKGFIVVNGCNPYLQVSPESYAGAKKDVKSDNDVWRAIVELRSKRKDLNIFTLDLDKGVGIITKGKPQKMLSYTTTEIEKMSFKYFDENRDELLNLKEFKYLGKFLNNKSDTQSETK